MASKQLRFSLDISKLNFMLKVLRFHKFPEARWFEFGLNLGLLHPTLEAIESAHRGNPSRCLMDCLAKWLNKADVTAGPVTWQALANAIRGLDIKSIANDIHKTMADPVSRILQDYIENLAQVALSEESVDLLHTEGVVSKATSTEVKSCGYSLVGDPLLLILRAVAEDHNKLCTLASILMKSKEAALLAKEIIMEYRKSFPSTTLVIPPCEQAIPSVMPASQLLQNNSTTDTQATDIVGQGVVEVILHPGHKAEFDRMGDLLGILIDDIAPLIKSSVPSLEEFKTFLRRCRSYLEAQLDNARTFESVMQVVEGECSIINVVLLETIVSKYSIQDAADKVLAYQTHLDEFCENNLTMFCNHQFKRLSSSLLTCETIKFVLKWNPKDHSLSNIRGLLWKTFKDNQVEVVVIEEGNSTIVTCYAPHYLMESLLLTARENLDVLKEEMGLISLTIGYFTVYDQHMIDKEVRSLMEKLEIVESERDTLLVEIAILKGSDNTGKDQSPSRRPVVAKLDDKGINSDDNAAEAAPHTWRHYKRERKEVVIIGSFGNHKQWPIKQQENVMSKLIPNGLKGSYDEWMKEEVEGLVKIYEKDPKNYDMKFICSDFPGMERSREYYVKNITYFLKNCEKDEAIIYYTGHGEKDTGNWCFKDGLITFDNIFNIYMEHFQGKSLQIISDCSYSGNWIKRCAMKLDECGILSCGHHTREQRVLLKMFTSCQPNEEATLLTFCRGGIRYSKEDKGVLLKYDEEIKLEQAQKGQNPMYIDFRHIHCYELPEKQCELDSTCTWEDRLGSKRERVFPVLNEDHWYYVLVDKEKIDEFKVENATKSIKVDEAAEYGKVLFSGSGKNPPYDIKKRLNLRFDVNTYAPFKYDDKLSA